jgi:hypothetical protein
MATVTVNQTKEQVNVTDFQGDTIIVPLQYLDSSGAPISMTGMTAKLQLFLPNDPVAKLTLTQASGIALGGSPHNIIMTITSAQSAGLAAGTYTGELVMTKTAGNVVDTLFTLSLTLQARKTQ